MKTANSLRKRFGLRLRRLRLEKELTQEQLAESINVSVEFISNLERGINGPSFTTLEKLAQKFEIEVKIFFEFDEREKTA